MEPRLVEQCTAAHNASACGDVNGVVRIKIKTDESETDTGDTVCRWQDSSSSCQVALDQSACETLMDEIEYLALFCVLSLLIYTAWITNSYALSVEEGGGRALTSGDADGEEEEVPAAAAAADPP